MTSLSLPNHVIHVTKNAMLIVALLIAARCSGQRCKIPKDWRGRYYQSGIGETFVRETRITTKGACIDRANDYFLFNNRENRCYQCLHIVRRHPNLIQYRESYCSSPGTLQEVCSHIRPNAPYVTLVREPAEPIACSVTFGVDAGYVFDYNDHTYGFCSRSTSHVSPCVNQTALRLHFDHCVTLATYSGRDLGMECLAAWTEDSESFLFARLTGFEKDGDGEYRCFKYSRRHHQLFIAMSADATCRGLRSARDGQFIMELQRDTFRWPSPSCVFPDWLDQLNWRDVSDTWQVVIGGDNRETMEVRRQSAFSPQFVMYNIYRCIEILDYYQLDEEYSFLSFSTLGCESKHQCLKLRKRSQFAVEIYQGKYMDHWSRGRCVLDADYEPMMLFVADSNKTARLVRCPHPGIYYMTGPAGGCVYRLDIGCHNDSAVHVESAAVCTGHSSSASFASRFVTMECRVTWSSDSATYLVTRDQHSNRLVCFYFVAEDDVISVIKDDECNLKTDQTETEHSTFTILRRDECPPPQITETINRYGVVDAGPQSFQTPAGRPWHQTQPASGHLVSSAVDYNGFGSNRQPHRSPSSISADYGDDDDSNEASSGDEYLKDRHGRRQGGDDDSFRAFTAYHVIDRNGQQSPDDNNYVRRSGIQSGTGVEGSVIAGCSRQQSLLVLNLFVAGMATGILMTLS